MGNSQAADGEILYTTETRRADMKHATISWVGPGYYKECSYGWVYVGKDPDNSSRARVEYFASKEDFYEQEG